MFLRIRREDSAEVVAMNLPCARVNVRGSCLSMRPRPLDGTLSIEVDANYIVDLVLNILLNDSQSWVVATWTKSEVASAKLCDEFIGWFNELGCPFHWSKRLKT